MLDAEELGDVALVFQGSFGAAKFLGFGDFDQSLELFFLENIGLDNGTLGADGSTPVNSQLFHEIASPLCGRVRSPAAK